MTPAAYDAWYDTLRGRWIGDQEFVLLARLLNARPGDTLLDVGCGTGYFSRRFVRESGLKVTGVDIDPDVIAFAKEQATDIEFALGNAQSLPYTDASFDHVVAVTSLCFVDGEARAVREMARIARQRVALGLLNRHSLLYFSKGRGQAGSYSGAHWHSSAEARALLERAGCVDVSLGSAVFLPDGGAMARTVERLLPSRIPVGSFLAVAATRPLGTSDRVLS
jgi:ubiquinone/menaquinone biosynthesis C-methylase UbiE